MPLLSTRAAPLLASLLPAGSACLAHSAARCFTTSICRRQRHLQTVAWQPSSMPNTPPPPMPRDVDVRSSLTSPPPSTPTKAPAPLRTSRLRPRKAALTLTPKAVQHVRALLSQPTPQLLRIGVRNRGCSGLAYHLEYVDKPGKFDETVEQDGVKVLIDSKALFSIIGSEMDWVSDRLSERFVFRNPNIKDQCGCGESFNV